MASNDLADRVSKLEKSLAAYSTELRFALSYVEPDAASSLTKSRTVLEKLVLQLFIAEMGYPPRKPMLGEMLADNQFTRRIDRRILSRMNSIRDMANLGSHGEPVQPSDALRVLDDLCEVLDWYLARSSPPAESEADAATRQKEELIQLGRSLLTAVTSDDIKQVQHQVEAHLQQYPDSADAKLLLDRVNLAQHRTAKMPHGRLMDSMFPEGAGRGTLMLMTVAILLVFAALGWSLYWVIVHL